MAWNEQRARERVAQNDFTHFDVNVADLSRTMDFHNLGTKDVRRVDGVHIYADVPNFHSAVDDAGADRVKQKKLLRASSVLRRMQGNLLNEHDIGPLQLQTARLHCLNFKPYDNGSKRVERAVVMAITLNSYLYEVFNDVFHDVRNFQGAVGVASGVSYVANIGFQGDRELISLGSCANLGAKIINGSKTITITEDTYKLLPKCLKKHFQKFRTIAQTLTYQAKGLLWSQYGDLAEELGVDFDPEALKRKTEEYRDALPLSEMEIIEAVKLIDLDNLTERNSKRTSAVAIFADLDGFTRYVQEAEKDGDVISLIRQLHMIRHEFHAVTKQDYPGLVLQHQGDRVFSIVHLPPGDDTDKRCQNALDTAIGLQSSMDHVLNEQLGSRKDIRVAIGLDIGTVLVTRLGKKGKREAICLGPKVTSAERLQLDSTGQEIRISQPIYEAITDEIIKDAFTEKTKETYSAKRLTFPHIDQLKEEKAAREGTLGAVISGERIQVATSGDRSARPWSHTKPWSSE